MKAPHAVAERLVGRLEITLGAHRYMQAENLCGWGHFVGGNAFMSDKISVIKKGEFVLKLLLHGNQILWAMLADI